MKQEIDIKATNFSEHFQKKMSEDSVCNQCGKKFYSKPSLFGHIYAVHTEVVSPCNVCDKTFMSKKKLTYHIRSTHAEEKEVFHCNFKSGEIRCEYFSSTNGNLKAHIKRIHDKMIYFNTRKLVCDLCGYKTNRKSNLGRHVDHCGKSLKPNLIDHLCNICQKMFSTKKILNRHIKIHNKRKISKPNFAALCLLCKKLFVNQWNMRRHQKKVHGLLENDAENSLRIAKYKTEVKIEEKMMSKRKEYLCHHCEYCSRNKTNLERHMNNRHSGIKRPETRGRKRKTGALSKRTQYRRKLEWNAAIFTDVIGMDL